MKTRSIHTLLKIVRGNFDKYFDEGFCMLISILKHKKIITFYERSKLEEFIYTHRPNQSSLWGWPKGETIERKKWLDEQIKRTSILYKLNIFKNKQNEHTLH